MRTTMGNDDARSDAELVAAAVGGDRAAFAAIYQRYVDRVHGFAYSFLRSSSDAADATQDTFVRAAEQLGNLRDPSKLRSWLFAIARTVCLAAIRRRGRDTPEPEMSALADAGAAPGPPVPGPATAAERSELARLVWDATAALDHRDRLVLELTVREGLDGGELADALGVSPAHAHVLAHRARQRVERALGAFLVARLGRRDCADLARLLTGWDGRFSMVVRKKVARHVDGCETCEDTRARTLSPVALLSAVPLVPMAADRRDAVLAAATSALGAGPAPRPDGYRDDGFPPADPVTRRRPRFAGWGAAAAVAAVVALLLLAVTGGGTGPTELTADEDSAGGTTAAAAATGAGGGGGTTIVAAPGGTGATVPSPAPSEPASGTPAATGPPAVAPTAPPTTTPATTTGPASTLPSPTLTVSSETVDLGTTGTTARVRVTNQGPGEAAWSARSPAAGLTVAPGGGTLAPDAGTDLVLTLDRAAFPEGPLEVAVGVDGGRQPVSVRVLAGVGRPPAAASEVTRRPAPPRAGTSSVCTPQTSRVVATVTDESGVAGAEVVLPAGRVAMTLGRDGTYGATVGPFAAAGTVTLTVEAVDQLGNRGTSAPVTLTVLPC